MLGQHLVVPGYVSAWPNTRITYWAVSVLGFTYYVLRIMGRGPNWARPNSGRAQFGPGLIWAGPKLGRAQFGPGPNWGRPNIRIEANTRMEVANTLINKVTYLRKDLRNYVKGHH